MSNALSLNYHFENFRLECGPRRLWQDDKFIKLTAKSFELLRYLIENRDRIVSQDELLTQVWAGLSVEANNVRVTIRQLRISLDDKIAAPKLIATIPKSGYRFIAAVAESSPENALAPALLPTILQPRQKEELEAEQFYLKGRRLIESHEPHAFEKGLGFLREAVRLHPQMIEAWVSIADSYIYLGHFHINSPHDVYPLAEQALHKALAINPKYPAALGSLGSIKLLYYWQGKEAAKLLRRAVQLPPPSEMVYYQLGLLGMMTENTKMAIDNMQRAIELSPLFFPAITGLAQALGLAGRTEEALEKLQNLITLEEQLNFGHYYLSRIYLNNGKLAEALEAAARACALLRHPMTFGLHGYITARMGQRQAARAILRDLRELGKRKFLSPYYLAEVYLGLGDYDRALPHLEAAYDMRMPQLFRLRLEPTFRTIIADDRMTSLIRRIKLT